MQREPESEYTQSAFERLDAKGPNLGSSQNDQGALTYGESNLIKSNDPSERATGVEPASEAWEASILPMNYAREPPSEEVPRS